MLRWEEMYSWFESWNYCWNVSHHLRSLVSLGWKYNVTKSIIVNNLVIYWIITAITPSVNENKISKVTSSVECMQCFTCYLLQCIFRSLCISNLTLECETCDQQTNTCLSGKIRWGILAVNKRTTPEFSDEPFALFILHSQILHHLLVQDKVVISDPEDKAWYMESWR